MTASTTIAPSTAIAPAGARMAINGTRGPALIDTSVLIAAILGHPVHHGTALRLDDRLVSYGELDRRARRLATGLRSSGLRDTDPMAIMFCRQHADSVLVALIANYLVGAVSVFIEGSNMADRTGCLRYDDLRGILCCEHTWHIWVAASMGGLAVTNVPFRPWLAAMEVQNPPLTEASIVDVDAPAIAVRRCLGDGQITEHHVLHRDLLRAVAGKGPATVGAESEPRKQLISILERMSQREEVAADDLVRLEASSPGRAVSSRSGASAGNAGC